MTDPSGSAKTLAVPAGFDAARLLGYDDVTAHAITRDDLGADVGGINASLDLIRETRGGEGHNYDLRAASCRVSSDLAHPALGHRVLR
jgi:hypothetical protein